MRLARSNTVASDVQVSLKHEVSGFLLFVAVEKLAREEAASYGKVKKQRVAQQNPSPLGRPEVSLRHT